MKNTEKDSLVSSVYNIIENRKGKVTAKHLEKEVGSNIQSPLCVNSFGEGTQN
jgi:hypothetical protein